MEMARVLLGLTLAIIFCTENTSARPRHQIFTHGAIATGLTEFNSGDALLPISEDINGDGVVDFVVIKTGGSTLQILRSIGREKWDTPLEIQMSDPDMSIRAAVAADANNDNITDIAYWATTHIPNELVAGFFLGDGLGTFLELPQSTKVLDRLNDTSFLSEDTIAAGDVTGDGIPDIVVSSDSLSVVAGLGGGLLSAPKVLNTGSFAVELVDLNYDNIYEVLHVTHRGLLITKIFGTSYLYQGILDIPSVNLRTMVRATARQDGEPGIRAVVTRDFGLVGVFTVDVSPDFSFRAGSVAEVYTTNYMAISEDILAGPGQELVFSDGVHFVDTTATKFGVRNGSLPRFGGSIAVSDVELDGASDLLFARNDGIEILRIIGEGLGRDFVEIPGDLVEAIGTPSFGGVGSGDFDGDGLDDVFVSNRDTDTSIIYYQNPNSTIERVLLHNSSSSARVCIDDLDGDGYEDVLLRGPGTSIVIHYGRENRGFGVPVYLEIGLAEARTIRTGDINNDTLLDIAVQSTGGVVVFVQTALRTYELVHTLENTESELGVAVGDIDGDGNGDIVFGAGPDSGIGVLLSNGDGSFASPEYFDDQPLPEALRLIDINDDGHLDLVNIAGLEDDVVVVYKNDGDGTFTQSASYSTGCSGNRGPQYGEVIDINYDGLLDIVALCPAGEIRVFLGDGKFGFEPVSSVLSGARDTNQLAFGDLNNDGLLDAILVAGMPAAGFSPDTIGFQYFANTTTAQDSCPPDLAEPSGLLDLADIVAFITAFSNQEAEADLAGVFGVFDLADLVAFVTTFNAGCD